MSIVHLFTMSSIESGSLTSKDGCIISLTPEDLENNCLADFSRHFRGTVNFFASKINEDCTGQVSFLNSFFCGNNQPNRFLEGPQYNRHLCHVIVT